MVTRRMAVLVIAASWVLAASVPNDVDGASVTFEHDARGRLKKARLDDGTVVDYTYDANGTGQAPV
jgi:hypothetical protein